MQNKLKEALESKVLVFDGAMGTEIYRRNFFVNTSYENLCLTNPKVIGEIHKSYLDAGAEVLTANSYGANFNKLAKFGLAERLEEINRAAVRIAKTAADGKALVAASVGPVGDIPKGTVCTKERAVEMIAEQVRALVKEEPDFILFETLRSLYDVEIAAAALESAAPDYPYMISVQVDRNAQTQSGDDVSAIFAFLAKVQHRPTAFGLNCCPGPGAALAAFEKFAHHCAYPVVIQPNAGMPQNVDNRMIYMSSPEYFTTYAMRCVALGARGVGGCCGTTPAHIGAIAKAVEGIAPRVPPQIKPYLRLSGLDPFIASPDKNFINVGERTNVAGSRKFLNLIKADDMHAAMSVALHQIENGASIIDINMDDAMLDSPAAMKRFLLYLASEPEISRVPIMVDSSDWEVVKTALRCIQGKSIVNSISLKEGEEKFLEKAREIRRLGAAILVMAFDEKGQADTLERRIKVCERSYRLLTEQAGVAPEDIVFDPNIFAVATGMKEHDNYAVDFIEAVRYIHTHMPLCGISGGVSNVSFSFRGNDTVRGAIHTVFLKHAIDAGMTMGIVNAAQLGVYEDLDPELRKAAEAVVLNTDPGAAEKMIEIASGLKTETKKTVAADQWRSEPLAERIARSLVKGDDSYVAEDMAEALKTYPSPMKIVEGPLMDGMGRVGELFSSGRMFLPQVVKSARVMKRSVAELMPAIEALKESGEGGKSCKVVIATVKGDVHDIGKNIVSVVLQCNNCTVVDLGVMVPAKTIVDAAVENNADVIGLSGLITPSLEEMVNVVGELERRGLKIPVLLGGAATSKLHTALKIQPFYSAPVIYTHDASASVPVVANLLFHRILSPVSRSKRNTPRSPMRSDRNRMHISPSPKRARKRRNTDTPRARRNSPEHTGSPSRFPPWKSTSTGTDLSVRGICRCAAAALPTSSAKQRICLPPFRSARSASAASSPPARTPMRSTFRMLNFRLCASRTPNRSIWRLRISSRRRMITSACSPFPFSGRRNARRHSRRRVTTIPRFC